MKKFITIILTIIICVSCMLFVGCESKKEEQEENILLYADVSIYDRGSNSLLFGTREITETYYSGSAYGDLTKKFIVLKTPAGNSSDYYIITKGNLIIKNDIIIVTIKGYKEYYDNTKEEFNKVEFNYTKFYDRNGAYFYLYKDNYERG